MWWWRRCKFRLNGVDVHCYRPQVRVLRPRTGSEEPVRRESRPGAAPASVHAKHRKAEHVATTGAMPKTWCTAAETVPAATEPAKITGVAVVAAKSANTMAMATALSTSTAVTNEVQEEG
ncbi:hypothetical protein D1007_43309 [Hordeum vulgare]|nr:hypothetical protein D1007_43309 [Hordeum vulgare]